MEEYFPSDHYITEAFAKLLLGFNEGNAAQTILVDIMWGAKDINKENVEFYNATDIGEPVYDENFDLSPP